MPASRRFVAVLLVGLASVAVACSGEEQKRRALASADTYAANGKYNEAIIEYRRAIQIDEKDGQARLRLARTYLNNDDATEGLREIDRKSVV